MHDGLTTYLAQFRSLSEAYWSTHTERTLDDFRASSVGGATWATGTRWQKGMQESEIAAVEAVWGATFPREYRAFLAALNAPDRPAHWYLYQGAKLEPAAASNIFVDWSAGVEDAKRSIEKVTRGIIFDVENNVLWQDEWGDRPKTADERAALIGDLVRAAPKLIPFHSHRFLVSGLDIEPSPVLSVMQSDIIIYADSLEQCLAADFPELAPGVEPPPVTLEHEERMEALADLPFWGGMVS